MWVHKGRSAASVERFQVASSIDLAHLARRESEQTEWKADVADINDVVRTLCAFANDLSNLGGGYVVCGAAEEKDEHGFPQLRLAGLSPARLKEVEGTTLARCRERVSPRITPRVEELETEDPGRRVLVFIQPSTAEAHAFRADDHSGKYYVRVSRETIEARNGTLRELLVRKGASEPWDRRMCADASVKDLDLLALRDALARMGISEDETGSFVSDTHQIHALVPPLCAREPLTGELRPRNFAMLLFGRHTTRFVPGAATLYSVYPGVDRSGATSERHEVVGTLVEQATKLAALLDLQATELMDKESVTQPNVFRYPKRALYEALGNALAHRDYESPDPTRITVFADRIEFRSPGGLQPGLDVRAFREGRLGPKWRNQALAWFFNRLQLAQAEGQGIPTILRTMRESGAPSPSFEADAVHVNCVLPAHPRKRREVQVREAEAALEQAERRLQRAKGEALLELDPFDPHGWGLFLKSRPPGARVSHAFSLLSHERVRELPPDLQVRIAAALIEDGQPENQQIGEKLLVSARSSLPNQGNDLFRNLEEDGHAVTALRLASEIAHGPDDYRGSLLKWLTSSVLLHILNRCTEFRTDVTSGEVSTEARVQSLGRLFQHAESVLARLGDQDALQKLREWNPFAQLATERSRRSEAFDSANPPAEES